MAGEVTFDVVNGNTKRVYDSSGLHNALPESAVLQKRIGFDQGSRKVGESYQIPVILQPPNGFTYPGSSGAVTALKSPRNMVIKQATVVPFEMELREQVAFAALSRAAEEGEGAFKQLAGAVMSAMKTAAANRLEMAFLDGQRPLGTIETVTDLGSQTADLTITAATWAPGRWWAIGKQATMDCFTSTSKNNSSGPLITAGLNSAARKVRVTYTGTLADEIDAGDVLYFEGAWDGTTYTEMPGLMTQAGNTTGTSLGLSATTYQNWAGNAVDVAGNISYEILEDACSNLRDRGADGKLTFLISNKGYSVLMNELKALRVFDSSYSPEKGKVGNKSMVAYSPDVGEIEIVNHPFIKWGEALIITEPDCARIGSKDMVFGVPGVNAGETVFWEKVPGYNAAEIQFYVDQCGLIKEPAHAALLTGITYT